MPESSPAEKEALFRELLAESEKLFNAFFETMEQGRPYDEDEFFRMETTVEDAALAALEAGNQAEHDRLMKRHRDIMNWRFV